MNNFLSEKSNEGLGNYSSLTPSRMRLIVNADDFGLSRGVNRGIVTAYRRGIVTSATLMVNQPGTEDAFRAWKTCPGLGLGIHLNLTTGRPLMSPEKVPSLVDKGGCFIRDAARMEKEARTDEVRAEWSAQIGEFIAHSVQPTHIDSHHFVHLLPRLARVAVDLAEEFSIPALRLVREADLPPTAGRASTDSLEVLETGRLTAVERLVAASRLKCPDAFFGLFCGSELSSEDLGGWLEQAWSGTGELMCHPGLVDEDLTACSSMLAEREKETALLTDARVLGLFKAHGVQLVSFEIFR